MVGLIPILFIVLMALSAYWGASRRCVPQVLISWAWVASLVCAIIGLIYVTGENPGSIPAWSGPALLACGVLGVVGSSIGSVFAFRK